MLPAPLITKKRSLPATSFRPLLTLHIRSVTGPLPQSAIEDKPTIRELSVFDQLCGASLDLFERSCAQTESTKPSSAILDDRLPGLRIEIVRSSSIFGDKENPQSIECGCCLTGDQAEAFWRVPPSPKTLGAPGLRPWPRSSLLVVPVQAAHQGQRLRIHRLRHASTRVTPDTYTQAVTLAKRAAQTAVVVQVFPKGKTEDSH